jgi:hypothetical protein
MKKQVYNLHNIIKASTIAFEMFRTASQNTDKKEFLIPLTISM